MEPEKNFKLMSVLSCIDSRRITVRDTLCLWAIQHNPGITGQLLANKLCYPSRSNVQDCIARLVKKGLVEDRRDIEARFVPNELHITADGIQFLDMLSTLNKPEN